MYTRTSPILNTSTPLDLDALFIYFRDQGAYRLSELSDYLHTVTLGAVQLGIDPIVMVAQWDLETDGGRSWWWRFRLNPAGLGITGDPEQNEVSQIWDSGTNAALGHLAHMTAYLWGEDWPDHWPDPKLNPIDVDQRFGIAVMAHGGTASTLQDLNGTWAVDPDDNYHGKLAERANRIMHFAKEQTPMATYDYNNGVHPPFGDYEVSENMKFAGYIDPAQHVIRGFVIHSAYGYLLSTTVYFQRGEALTDYMVGNLLDGSARDGELRRFNNPIGPRYSHASGPVNNPIEDAAKFLEIYGPNPSVINMYTTALERTCDVNGRGAVSEKEHQKRVRLIAYWANKYGKYLFAKTGEHRFTCDTFPIIPSENNRSFLIYHGEINAGKRTVCPDAQVRATLQRIIADVRALLAEWQKHTTEIPPEIPPAELPIYAAPVRIAELEAYKDKDTAPAYAIVGTDIFTFVNDRVRAKKATPRYQDFDTNGERIGPDIEAGLEFAVLWLTWDDEKRPWYVTPYWTRVLVHDTERISDEATV